jgi:NAD(P)-dependent dehydrogenase (short-subunit alcohol dehydrogenase family)
LGLIGQTDIQRTVDGNEWSFQVNHLGPFYLTLELLPIILSSAPGARIVFVSSVMHKYANAFNPNNLQGEQGYSGTNQYSNTKLFNIMTAYALQRKLGSGKGVTVSALHPGFVRTEFGRNATTVSSAFIALGNALGISRTPKEGAATTLYAAVHPGLNKEEFVYYSDCKVTSSSEASRNVDHQEQLWDISCKLLKDYLSPDIWREYGPSQPTTSGERREEEPPSEQVEEHPSDQVEEHPSEKVEEQPTLEQM